MDGEKKRYIFVIINIHLCHGKTMTDRKSIEWTADMKKYKHSASLKLKRSYFEKIKK
jgi:hypothetical protein